jgi:hypothetical protein
MPPRDRRTDQHRTARGVVRVTAVNANGDRARIASVTGDDLREFLERDGFPELMP